MAGLILGSKSNSTASSVCILEQVSLCFLICKMGLTASTISYIELSVPRPKAFFCKALTRCLGNSIKSAVVIFVIRILIKIQG